MLEKLLLAAAITFSLHLILGVSAPAATQRDSELNRQPSAAQIAMASRSQPFVGAGSPEIFGTP